MRRLVFVFALFLCSISASAQSVRTWVSNSGVDTASCGLSAPCRTFQYALSVTAPGGDIVALNSGGFGNGLNIAQAVNIIVPDGIYAAISTLTNAGNGITISAGLSDVIRIKGLSILGVDTGGSGIGVYIGTCKRTELLDFQISRISVGVKVVNDVRAYIKNLTISDTNIAIWSIGSQTAAQVNGPAAPPLKVTVVDTKIVGTAIGAKVDSGSFQMVEGDEVSYASTDSYQIQSIVTSCSGVSLSSNTNGGSYYNTTTGLFNSNCSCFTQDLRNGMQNNGTSGCSSP